MVCDGARNGIKAALEVCVPAKPGWREATYILPLKNTTAPVPSLCRLPMGFSDSAHLGKSEGQWGQDLVSLGGHPEYLY